MRLESTELRPKTGPETPKGNQQTSPAFKAAINRFWADRVTTKGPKQETETPEINLIEKIDNYQSIISRIAKLKFLPSKPDRQELQEIETYSQHFPINEPRPAGLFHRLRRATRPSKDGHIVRSLATRAVRARIYKETKSIQQSYQKEFEYAHRISGRPITEKDRKKLHHQIREAQKPLIAEAQERDKLARDFLNQSEITVNLMLGSEPLGEQTARYVTLEPPKRDGQAEQPPVFLIPGISNDLDSVAGLVQEAAYSGRKVIAVAYPDAWLGKVTPQFAKAVAEDPNFGPHAALNKAMIDKLVPQGEFELWSFSTGGPIEAEILNDPKYQTRVSKAVLVAPASVINQPIKTSLFPGLGHDIAGMRNTIQRYTYILGGKDQKLSKEENTARAATSAALIDRVARSMPDLYEGARVKEGGQILVISEERDDVTKTEKGKSIFNGNPQMEVVTLKGAYHNTAVTEPERIISTLHQLQTTQPQEV